MPRREGEIVQEGSFGPKTEQRVEEFQRNAAFDRAFAAKPKKMMRLPCPHDGCPGVEVCEGKIDGCGHPSMTSATADCPWADKTLEMPECAVDRDEEGAVWIEIVDGVTDRIPVATELAEHLEGEDGWELRFDAIVTMQMRDRDGEQWWVETTEPGEGARQFWRFEYWEAK